jgi:hypothetical protein
MVLCAHITDLWDDGRSCLWMLCSTCFNTWKYRNCRLFTTSPFFFFAKQKDVQSHSAGTAKSHGMTPHTRISYVRDPRAKHLSFSINIPIHSRFPFNDGYDSFNIQYYNLADGARHKCSGREN